MINWIFIQQVGLLPWAARYSRRQFHKRVLHRDSRLRLPTGNWIILPLQSGSATEVYVTNANIDWGAEALFSAFAEPGRDFLDIGSHIGYYAAYLSPRVRHVFAFEPDQRNLPTLRRNASLSGNVEVVESAVSSYDGIASFFAGEGSAVASLENIGGPATEVPVCTVDSFVASRPGLDVGLVKTDVEGHDLEVLRGMHATITRCQPLILTECSYSPDLVNFCDSCSYIVFAFTCDRNSLKTHFRELGPDDTSLWLKMLFLVPPRLHASFRQIVSGGPLVPGRRLAPDKNAR